MEHPARVGKYKIEKFLGGGMSHVYKATDSVLGRLVAVKVLTETAMTDPDAKARFLEEAKTASNLRHEHIINVYDFGEEDGRPYMVMEFLEGESLRDSIKKSNLGSLERRLKIAIQVGRAIDYIHNRKIIHRDIKPENINVDLTGKAKLMDFGIAKSEGIALTRAGFTVGTPYYMAPEQVLGRPVTPQADIYSYGVVLYEMLTGQKPITEQTVEKIFQQVIYQPLPMEPLKKAQVPAPISDLIVRATAKQVTQRPLNLGVVCDELERFLAQEAPAPAAKPVTAAVVPVQQPPLAARPLPAPSPSPAPARPALSAPMSPALLMALAFAGMLALVFFLYFVLVRLHLL
jgi:eukaryotic-like serine/threonine-protein kinase